MNKNGLFSIRLAMFLLLLFCAIKLMACSSSGSPSVSIPPEAVEAIATAIAEPQATQVPPAPTVQPRPTQAPTAAPTQVPEVTSSPSGKSCPTKPRFGDGRGGTLWKESEHSNQFVLLLPNPCRNTRVQLCATKCIDGRYTGLANPDAQGDRHHWRWLGSSRDLRNAIGRGRVTLRFGGHALALPGSLRERHD